MPTMSDAAAERIDGTKPHPSVNMELLDVRAVAHLLGGCSIRHVIRLADASRMPKPVKLGTLVRWRKAEVLAWISAGCPPLGRWKQVEAGR